MKYGFITTEIDHQSTEILQKIRLSMNGITSDQMTKSGMIYKKSYGVSIPRIKEIAADYAPNHTLAQHLWKLSIRETMILATLLESLEEFTPEMAKNWISKLNQIEIIEQSCMNLFCKLPYAASLSCDCLQSENDWKKITGFVLAARIYKQLKKLEINFIIQKALENASTDNFHLYKSVALCLSRMCRLDTNIVHLIWEQILLFKGNPSISQRYIYTEVEQEIIFLDIL